ncbi:MAG: penicillin-binding protein [Oscillospiraceae bacterium]|nr:penicillin-binding protein [Oscillospiraceae bacterium]
MKSIAKRTYFALILACILLFGVLTFAIRYFLYADRWVSFTGSPHVYTNGKLDTGEIVDRSGEVLYTSAADRTYSGNASLRKATLHLIGDKAGNIPPRILRAFASKLFGYDKLNGTAAMETSGGELRLTVSAQVQAVAMQAMNGRKGAVGVYNYRTGEILCAVSSPSFDPLDPPNLETDNADGRYDGVYIYRFFHARYTPGSIFKLTTLAAALDAIPGLREETFTCTGERIINGEKVTCPKAHGQLTLRDALAQSCNCTFAEISLRTGKSVLTGQAEAERLTENIEIDGITTIRGNFDLSDATDNDLAWAGIGQYTDLVNPCQYMVYMGAIAGGGTAAEPCLVSSARSGGRETYAAEPRQTPRMLSESAAKTLREFMRYNVTKMYGGVDIPGVEVCAKSGTAEVGSDFNTATFAGFIADSDYPLAFIVVVEEGGAGSSTCAPIAKTVLQACMNVLDGER